MSDGRVDHGFWTHAARYARIACPIRVVACTGVSAEFLSAAVPSLSVLYAVASLRFSWPLSRQECYLFFFSFFAAVGLPLPLSSFLFFLFAGGALCSGRGTGCAGWGSVARAGGKTYAAHLLPEWHSAILNRSLCGLRHYVKEQPSVEPPPLPVYHIRSGAYVTECKGKYRSFVVIE